MKVIVLKEFCGIEKDKELDLPSYLAGPLIEQGIVLEMESEAVEVIPEPAPIEPEPLKEPAQKVKK